MDQMNSSESATEMPRYRCFKEVHALKISSVGKNPENGNAILVFDGAYQPKEMTAEYGDKHSPKEGGYYVLYADGYESFSPAEAFENGYEWIGGNKP